MARLVAKLLVTLVAVLGTLYVAERALRAAGYEYRPMSVAVGQMEDARLFHLFQDEHFIYHPETIWQPRPGFEIFNSQGFRGPELPVDKPEAAKWIFTVGDSNTLGWAGEDGPNWPGILAEQLRARDERIQVINAGVWGYSSFQGLHRLDQILPYAPDLVLVSFGSNDAHQVGRPDADFVRSSQWGRKVTHFLGAYRLGQLMIASRDRLTAPAADEASAAALGDQRELSVRVPLDDYRDNLRQMARKVREAGGEVVFLTRPFHGYIRSATWWKNRGFEYNRATAEVAAELGATLIDVYSFFKALPDQFSDESHFTADGHRLAAILIRDELKPALHGQTVEREAARKARRARGRRRGE